MLLLDIDRFKKLNDTFGHQVGDTALRSGEHLRKLNSTRVLSARYGGEEFAVVVLDATIQELRGLAERFAWRSSNPDPLPERNLAITVSNGGP